ncbi:MAG: Gx transporter family protein [Clostridia bacterium]|nr:Gx transporter family protein [Clostridia bacterium]
MPDTRRNSGAARAALCGLLLAVMLVLGFIESTLPSGAVPGIKLGLSNGVLIFAVYLLDIPTAYILMSLKVLLSGLLFGGVSAMIYGFAGGLLSLTLMALLSRVKGLSPVVVSMAGGAAHNIGQVGMAMLIVSTAPLLGYLAVLLPVGLACGALTGIAAKLVMQHLRTVIRPVKRASRRQTLVVLLAALLVIAVGVFALLRLPRGGVVIESEALPTMIPAVERPF